jgi:flavin-dependent dehydrogenase
VEAPFSGALDRTYIFLEKSLVGGYGWVFPKGRTANVGIGVAPRKGLDMGAVLNRFVDHVARVGLIRPGQLARSGGLIPVSGIRDSLVAENVVFCGDAAGLTHPITGAGIPQAVFSGQQAGRAVAAAIKSGRREHLADYEAEIRSRYRGALDHALKKRQAMIEQWNDPEFSRVCDRTWIAFKGYKKRERRK